MQKPKNNIAFGFFMKEFRFIIGSVVLLVTGFLCFTLAFGVIEGFYIRVFMGVSNLIAGQRFVYKT